MTVMEWHLTTSWCVILLIAVIAGVDMLFLRGRFWERLIVNIGIVLLFATLYLRFADRM